MKHPERAEDYLEHIVEAIERATEYLRPLPDIESFRLAPQIQDAVIRNVEIIGEAVNKIQRNAPALLQEAPEIPWEQMRGMRNVVIHEYFYVDLQVVWTTVRNDFPLLLDQIRALQQRRWKQQA